MKAMRLHWCHKLALDEFAHASRSLRFHQTLGVGEATWKTLIEMGWIKPVEGSTGKWRDRPYEITAAGRQAFAEG
jgi:hypothetical protein